MTPGEICRGAPRFFLEIFGSNPGEIKIKIIKKNIPGILLELYQGSCQAFLQEYFLGISSGIPLEICLENLL